jgi:hypothetical protein
MKSNDWSNSAHPTTPSFNLQNTESTKGIPNNGISIEQAPENIDGGFDTKL